MVKTKKITRKQEKQIINSIVYQMIKTFDITAFDDTDLIDENMKVNLSEKIRLVSKKFETDCINIGNVNKLLEVILLENKAKND